MNHKGKEKQSRNIEVAVRMRPLLHLFEDEEVWEIRQPTNTITSLNDTMLSAALRNISDSTNNQSFLSLPTASKPKKKSVLSAVEKTHRYEFNYDYAFGPIDTNTDVYEKCCQNIVNQFCSKGRNGTIFMYGQTTSGKTYTMLGDEHSRGLISFSLGDICQQILDSDSTLTVSYLEIYNEQINDLLNPGSVNLKIADDQVLGAQSVMIDSFDQAMDLLSLGEEQRSYSEKKYHDHSSRSHTIFQIRKTKGKSKAVLNLVDLAGSERLSDEETNEETGYINKSLFVLSTVIHRLASGKKNHVPFRDSKLTRILAPSLSGQGLTTVICTISPAAINFYQTLSTLRFASCSRKVELKPLATSPQFERENSLTADSREIERLRRENEKLRKDVLSMSTMQESQENFLESKVRQVEETLSRQKHELHEGWKEKLNMLCCEYRKNISTLQKQYTKALINAVSVECEYPKQSLGWALEQFK